MNKLLVVAKEHDRPAASQTSCFCSRYAAKRRSSGDAGVAVCLWTDERQHSQRMDNGQTGQGGMKALASIAFAVGASTAAAEGSDTDAAGRQPMAGVTDDERAFVCYVYTADSYNVNVDDDRWRPEACGFDDIRIDKIITDGRRQTAAVSSLAPRQRTASV